MYVAKYQRVMLCVRFVPTAIVTGRECRLKSRGRVSHATWRESGVGWGDFGAKFGSRVCPWRLATMHTVGRDCIKTILYKPRHWEQILHTTILHPGRSERSPSVQQHMNLPAPSANSSTQGSASTQTATATSPSSPPHCQYDPHPDD